MHSQLSTDKIAPNDNKLWIMGKDDKTKDYTPPEHVVWIPSKDYTVQEYVRQDVKIR